MAGNTLAELFVRIGADMTGFNKSLGRLKRDIQSLGQDLQSAGATMTAAFTAPLVAAGVAAARLAMEAVESENLFEVSMGRMAKAARTWSEELRDQLGLNAYEVRKNAGTLNAMLKAMELGEQAAYDMSTSLTKLAYDMSSFHNIPVQESFEKIRAGISGESEPLKQLGIVVNETTTKLWALEHGLIQQGETLTEQQKILARYGVIMEQTALAQGDLARTLDSPTNQIRIMGEQVKQLGIDLGMTLLPVISDLIEAGKPLMETISDAVQRFRELDEETRRAVLAKLAFAATAGPVLMAVGGILNGVGHLIGVLRVAIGTLRSATAAVATLATVTLPNVVFAFQAAAGGAATFGEALAFLGLNPVVLAIAAVAALTGGIYLYVRAQQRAREEEYQRSKTLLELSRRHDELRAVVDDGTRTEEERAQASRELQVVMDEIAEKFPGLIQEWDDHGKAVAVDTEMLRENTRAAEENSRAKARTNLSNLQNRAAMLRSRRDELERLISEMEALGVEELEPDVMDQFAAGLSGMVAPGQSLGDLRAELGQVKRDLADVTSQIEQNLDHLFGEREVYDWDALLPGEQDARGLQEVNTQLAQLNRALNELSPTSVAISDAGLVAARRAWERARAIGNTAGEQMALSIMEAAASMSRMPAFAAAGGAAAAPAAPTVQLGGTVRVEVTDARGTVLGYTDVQASELLVNQDRYSPVRSRRRIFQE